MLTNFDIVPFESQAFWGRWLEENHSTSCGLWIQFFKKGSGVKTISYAEALETALTFGWIDSQTKSYDEKSYLQKFTPRGPKSIWSKINTQHIERLIQEGRMKPAGVAAVEAAKKDGRWKNAYDSPATISIPEDFLKQLTKNRKAKEFFESLNKANIYAIAWRLQTAKRTETLEKRKKIILEMLSRGEKFH